MTRISREVEIVNQRGLHARASAKFVSAVSELPEDLRVSVSKDGMDAEGGSILGLMMLGAAKGAKVTIIVEAIVEGTNGQDALEKLCELVIAGFGEE